MIIWYESCVFHYSKDACVLSESVQKKEKKGKKGEYDQVTVLTLECLIPVGKDDCFVTFLKFVCDYFAFMLCFLSHMECVELEI